MSDLGVSCFSLIQESLVSLRFLGFVYIMAGRLLAVSVVSQVLNSTNISLQKHVTMIFHCPSLFQELDRRIGDKRNVVIHIFTFFNH